MARASATKKRIQEIAQELFAQQGVRNTSLRQIAERTGITKPALYYHFTSRDELVRSIIQPLIDDTDAFLASQETGNSRRLLEGYFDLLWQHRETLIMMLRDPSTLAYLNLHNRVFGWRHTLTRLLIGDDTSIVAQVRTTVALGGLSDCAVERADLPFEEVRPAAVDAALAALGTSS